MEHCRLLIPMIELFTKNLSDLYEVHVIKRYVNYVTIVNNCVTQAFYMDLPLIID